MLILLSPSLQLWEQQATYLPAAVDGSIGPGMESALMSNESRKIITDAGERWKYGLVRPIAPPTSGADLLLLSLVELTYKVPSGTSLVRVLGPIGVNPAWAKDIDERNGVLVSESGTDSNSRLKLQCTFLLEPQPPWIDANATLPISYQDRIRNSTNETLFLIPLDPTVDYKLKVLPPNNRTVCVMSGVQTYPFK